MIQHYNTKSHQLMKRRRSSSTPLICEENLKGLLGPLKTRSVAKSAGSRENAENSPLLRLPAELRLRIFEYVLGGQTIHIDLLSQSACLALRRHDVWIGLGLYNEICQAEESEEEVYARFRDPSQDSRTRTPFFVGAPIPPGLGQWPRDLGHRSFVEAWSTRHAHCGEEPNLRRIRQELEVWLKKKRYTCALLRVCRQVYAETRTIPYSANTFCFRSATSFQTFALSIRPEQTRALQHLNFLVGVGTAPFSNARARSWVHALRLHSIVKWLEGGVRTLDVSVEMYMGTSDPSMPRKPGFEQFFEVLRSPDGSPTSWMAQLGTLVRGRNQSRSTYGQEKKHRDCKVRVIVADDPFSAWGAQGSAIYRRDYRFSPAEYFLRRALGCLTISEKRDVGRRIEELLRVDESEWKEVLDGVVGGRQHPDSD